MPFTDVPPSYEYSISREAWTILAPYIPSADLCACCLVSRKWHSIFVPFLWGDPASHFGIANDAVYVALTRFKKTLRRARLSVRSLTHTLHLPPALSEIYGGPHATWLRDVLEYLPNLQSLIVTKLPFFDHHSLVALRLSGHGRRGSEDNLHEQETFGLKLLLASSEPNTTSVGLSIALPKFPNLVYLDLSYTRTARDASVLAALSNLQELQTLKLQGVGMKDGEAEVLANAIGIRVRLLDIRDNHLTDMAVRSLLQACFLPVDMMPDASRLNTRRVEDWPTGMAPGPDFFSLDTLRGEELDHELLKQLTNPLTGRLAFEDIPHQGLTHLYIANNPISVEGLSSLLKTRRLHILDGGSADAVKTIARTSSITSPTGYVDEVKFPGAEKLIPVLAQCASENLTYLRVDHALITTEVKGILLKDPPKPKASAVELADNSTTAMVAELQADESSRAELPASKYQPVELPASAGEQIFELDATPAEPRAELPGDMIHFALSPPVGEKPQETEPEPELKNPIRGEGPYAPEVVVNGSTDGHATEEERGEQGEEEVVLNATGTVQSQQGSDRVSDESPTNSTVKSLRSPVSPVTPHATVNRFQPLVAPNGGPPPTSAPMAKPQPLQPRPGMKALQSPAPSPSVYRQARIEHLLSLRPRPFGSRQNTTNEPVPRTVAALVSRLHPCLLPNLRTLVLTSVPFSVPASSPILPALKSFISDCASESALSHLLAATDYSLPPGRARYLAEKAAAKRLFALHTIILEMEQPLSVANKQSGHRAWEHSRQRLSMSKSSTGDWDSENLWTAAADDFSFFAEDGGEEADECGIYDHEKDKYFPTATFDDKVAVTADDDGRSCSITNGPNSPHGSFASATLSPVSALARGNTSTGNAAIWKSPRNLPMGRNRRLSNESRGSFDGGNRPFTPELPGQLPSPRQPPPTSNPYQQPNSPRGSIDRPVSPPSPEPEPQVDVVSGLAAWRRERKATYETEMMKYQRFKTGVREEDREGLLPPFVEGHWKGQVKVIRNAAPKGRSGVVDMYGNYFEKGYLYP